MPRCIAITPARDEEQLLPGLIASMTAQRIKVDRWIVIDDGSADRSAEILDAAAHENPWIEVHHLPRNRDRGFGGESVVMKFLPRTTWENYDFVLRLDADLTFGPEMIESLLAEFTRDPKLGIAGAVLLEPGPSGWEPVYQPEFHTRGAVKMYSSKCFGAIGGLQAGIGWDTIDETQAMMLGFRTRSFPEINARHHRPQGLAGGLVRSRFNSGYTAYLIGYSPIFMLVRALRRAVYPPRLIGSAALLAGFVNGYLRRSPKSASPELVKFIRREQHRRLMLRESLWR